MFVGRATGFDRIVHHPRAMGVVIPADKPWETCCTAPNFFARRPDGTCIAFYNVLYWTPDPQSKTQPDRAQQYRRRHRLRHQPRWHSLGKA